MKKVVCFVLNQDEEFFITDEEWKEYREKMNDSHGYWCERLETLFPPNPKLVQTPPEDVGFNDIYLEIDKQGNVMDKWYFYKERWWRDVNGSKFDFTHLKKDKKLIEQEKYYKKRYYLYN